MKKVYFILILILLVSIATSGCGISSDKAAAENVAAKFFEAVRSKDFDTAITFYSPKFFELNPNVDWLKVLKGVNNKLGDLETYKLVGWHINRYHGITENGTYCELKYEVSYSKYPATETLTLFKPATGGEFKIVRHDINSFYLITE